MINYYFKNRLFVSVVFTIFAVFIAINFASNIASSIDQTANIVSNNDDIEESIILIDIPQGSSAAQISSILAQEGIISSSLAFEIYLRNENLGDKLRAGEYEISNKLEFEEISNILLKGPPLKTYTITIPEGLWITETIESISSQTGCTATMPPSRSIWLARRSGHGALRLLATRTIRPDRSIRWNGPIWTSSIAPSPRAMKSAVRFARSSIRFLPMTCATACCPIRAFACMCSRYARVRLPVARHGAR